MRSLVIDSFMINDELDMLECRLTELASVVDHFIAVEADVDHQDHSKPYLLTENEKRFKPWQKQLCIVRAKGMLTAKEAPDPWTREHAQREFVQKALKGLNTNSDTIILHGDVDEIPTISAIQKIRELCPLSPTVNGSELVVLSQKLYCFAVDWLHPNPWLGTAASMLSNVKNFNHMRDTRGAAPSIPNGGWHLSWLGGKEAQKKKLTTTPHLEIIEQTTELIIKDTLYQQGMHVDGTKLTPVNVDQTWPEWISQKKCPTNWFRPRSEKA
jgi:beta-1,4-mannosyl-glycoprotein beta-1,4-N-acetylglucosaminyltransferase